MRIFIIIFLSFVFYYDLKSQGQQKIIQLSGVVVGQDSISGVGGVHIYVPKAGRGTTSNPYGYFAMPVLANDSIIVSAIGYQKKILLFLVDIKLLLIVMCADQYAGGLKEKFLNLITKAA